MARSFIVFGVGLHTYTSIAEAPSFHVGFWLLSIAPYIIGGFLLWQLGQSQAAMGALFFPAIFDAAACYSVFISPDSSTAPLILAVMPFWNLGLFVPLGGGVGWWVGKRLRETARSNRGDL